MKHWIIAGAAAFAIAGLAHGAGFAQGDAPARAQGGPMAGLRQACRADVEKLCNGVQPGGGRVMDCMREHRDELSDGCRSALMSVHGHRPGDQTGAPPATSSPQG